MEQLFIHRVSIAPMIDITHQHFRVFFRFLSKCCVLYTEMIHENAINLSRVNKPHPIVLEYSQCEHPVVCQLGGNLPDNIANAALQCQKLGYDEVNLNVGCPSERVQDGAFGACLMKEPKLVAKITKAVLNTVNIPCTVKCRLGVDDQDSYEFVRDFVGIVSQEGGVQHFIIHARKAYLKGLNPHENRTVPPLRYEYVYRLKDEFKNLKFSLNGGLKCMAQIDEALQKVDGVMIGRSAYENPWMFSIFDNRYFGVENLNYSRREILLKYAQFVEEEREKGNKTSNQMCVKPLINLFNGEAHNKRYRQFLSTVENHTKYGSFRGMIEELINRMEEWNKEALDIRPNDYKFNINNEKQ